MNGKRYENRSRRNGFYLALAVCLIAIGVAAWSTYDAVNTYTAENNGRAAATPQAVATPRPNPEDPESSRARSDAQNNSGSSIGLPAGTASAAPARQNENGGGTGTAGRGESSAPARQTTGAVTETPAQTVSAPETGVPENDGPAETPVNAPAYEISEEMAWPLAETEVQQAYSAGAPVYSQTMKDWRIHAGLDLLCESGSDVWACANGRVLRCESDVLLGNLVVIEHGDYQFSYCGVGENFLVQEGDVVSKGQVIARVTAVPSESAEAPHLHLEVTRDGAHLDPEKVLAGQA